MSTSIKRLEIIKNAIELEDDDIIQSQLTRLKMKRLTMSYRQSSWRLKRRTTPLRWRPLPPGCRASAVTQWRDPQVAASKLELKALEERLRDLIDRRNVRCSSLMSSTISISLASGR
jgi:hypothetical protein